METYPILDGLELVLIHDVSDSVCHQRYAECYHIEERLDYVSYANDFGPYNLANTYYFCATISEFVQRNPEGTIAVISLNDAKSIANASFLIGAYLIMCRDLDLDTTSKILEDVVFKSAGFCDVSRGVPTFLLSVRDCWAGLLQAKQLKWISFNAEDENQFDIFEYTHLDNPLNADMHVIVPGKLIAMRGPKDVGDRPFIDTHNPDGSFRSRDFSPHHYADILRQFDVQAVIRLNEHCYDAEAFRSEGIAVADLFFDDCTPPSALVVAKFLAMAESVPGALAVHCKAGLGRTGTLIALYMMKHHGFSARAAMGWLRIVRPGSVIGSQQGFLVEREAAIARNRHHRVAEGAEVAPGAAVGEMQGALDRTCAALEARLVHASALLALPCRRTRSARAVDAAADDADLVLRRCASDSRILPPAGGEQAALARSSDEDDGAWDPASHVALVVDARTMARARQAAAAAAAASARGGPPLQA